MPAAELEVLVIENVNAARRESVSFAMKDNEMVLVAEDEESKSASIGEEEVLVIDNNLYCIMPRWHAYKLTYFIMQFSMAVEWILPLQE